MGMNVKLVVDTNGVDYRAAQSGSPELENIAGIYRRCMGDAGINTPPTEVRPFHLTELGMVELDGPWQSVAWIGSRALTLGVGQKWGVFLTDPQERVAILQEAVCLGRAVNCRQLVGFPDQGRGQVAAELSLSGASVPELVAKLEQDGLKRFELSVRRDASIESLSIKLGEMAAKVDDGFFVINFVNLLAVL